MSKGTDAPLSGTLLSSQWRSMLDTATAKAAQHNRLANALSGPSERAGQRAQRAAAKRWEALVQLCSDILEPKPIFALDPSWTEIALDADALNGEQP